MSCKKDGVGDQRSVWKRRFLAAAVCLGLLCVLLLAGIIGLLLYREFDMFPLKHYSLSVSYNNLTKERDQLQTCNKYGTCPQDWIRSCCSCYYISTNEKTWDGSRNDCQARGANLVIINSREEQALIKAFNKRAWFGLTDIEVEGTWRWVDGTPLTTSYWNKGEPNDFEGEDCALVDNTLKDPVVAWNDVSCNRKNGWICERQLC
ncbi:CD209 antigen-like protein C [Oncorhynchus mykiss]|uniref:CD209 antigen-like protein C n=1 Tax=Oncorhynchus mykiss TaxID=8022 RepID=UPI0018788F3D|nr:CD209 antigen-like protein C [Oncorhynchus mykiss]